MKPLLYPFTAMLGIYEIALMLIALAVGVAIATGGIVFLIWLVNRARQTPPSPQSIPGAPPVSSATQPVASSVIAASASVSTGPCPRCGAAVDPNSPQGLCPKCLLAVGMGTQPSAGADPVPPPDPAELADRFPNLEILELIGAGGMGVVYKARQRQLDRLVALKVLPREAARDPAFAERFHREARMLARLNHPSIITVHEFGETDGLYYLVMEYVDGTDLRRILQERRLTPAEALQIVPALCDALQYAHANGVVHRDIKPGNILLDREGRIKIADFGIAKLLGQASADLSLTQTHQSMGTPHYMAPEQAENPQAVDHRADIYSLGVVFYEMLTGELPLGRFSPPSRKVEVDVRFDEVVLRALEKEPARRYQQAGEIKTEVERINASSGAAPVPSPLPHSPVRKGDWKITAAFLWMALLALFLPLWAASPRIPSQPVTSSPADVILLLGFLSAGILAAFAPAGSTLLGMLALRDIRNGRTRRENLKAALIATLAFPWLTIGIVVCMVWLLLTTIVTPIKASIPLSLAALTLGALTLWPGRSLWRWLERRCDPAAREPGESVALLLPVLTLVTQCALAMMLLALIPARWAVISTVHYEGALPSPVPGQSLVTEQPRGWELTTAGPVIASHISGAFLSDLEPDDRAALDAALKRAYRSYEDIISRNLTRTTNAAGHTVIMIPSATREMEEIESGFWSVADDVLDEQQETVLRANLRLRPRGYALDTPETSPLFRFGTRPFALEYWRVGNWYEWRQSEPLDPAVSPQPPHGPTRSAPALPEALSHLIELAERAEPVMNAE